MTRPESSSPFPEPETISGRNYWTRGAIRRWRALNAGQPEPSPKPDDEFLLSAKQVRDLFGGVSDMWLWRRRREAREQATAA